MFGYYVCGCCDLYMDIYFLMKVLREAFMSQTIAFLFCNPKKINFAILVISASR